MDRLTQQKERAERDAELLRMAGRCMSLAPTERQRLLQLRDERRGSRKRKDIAVVEVITTFFGDGGKWTADSEG